MGSPHSLLGRFFDTSATRATPLAGIRVYNADFAESRLIELATVLLLALHLLAMNVASAGPLVGVWLARCGSREELGLRVGRRLAGRSLWALATGALLGGAMLLLPSEGVR